MDDAATTNILIIIGLVLLALIAGGLFIRNSRTKRLREQFGPEYGRTVKEAGGRVKAEAALAERTKRVEALALQPISPEDREGYVVAWQKVQADFVDDPKGAFNRADEVLTEVMTARGYPTSDFERQSADLSVHHAGAIQNYRAAHDIAGRNNEGTVSTEDLRQGMIHYRSLFDELLNEQDPDISDKNTKKEITRERAK